MSVSAAAMTATPSRRAIAWQSQSLLLAYPDERLRDDARLVRALLSRLSSEVADPLARFLDHVERTPLLDLATDYVATLDHKKNAARCFSPTTPTATHVIVVSRYFA